MVLHFSNGGNIFDYQVLKTIMTGYVYMLLCANGKLYTGSTVDLLIRLGEHQEGIGANFTRKNQLLWS